MKNINFYIVAFSLSLLAISCDSDDKVVIDVLEGQTSGAILRTRSESGSFDMFRPERVFAVTVEEQDEDNGELIDRVDITVDYIDNNDEGGVNVDDTMSDVPFGTLAATDFTIGERGLPEASFEYSLQDALDALSIPLIRVLPGDRVRINFELFFTDGRSFKEDDAAVTVTGGSFFASPFQYTRTIDDGITFVRQGINANDLNLAPGQVNEDYSVSLSFDDGNEDGDLLETLNIYKTFRDLTIGEDGTDLSQEEALFATFNIADLMEDEDGNRLLDFSIPTTPTNVLESGVSVSELSLGDDFQIRYEIITTDGRIVTSSSDIEYFETVETTECIQLNRDSVVPGDYTIEFEDSFGDGWDGAFITVTINGMATDYTLESGSSTDTTIVVPEGTTTLIFSYTAGSFEEEHSYVIVDPFGGDAAADGPNPAVGEIAIRVCQAEE